MIKKLSIIGALVLLALAWVQVMALEGIWAGSKPSPPPPPGAAPWTEDGKVKAEVVSLLRQDFHLTLALKITDPDGKTIGGLGRQEIEVTEDGVPVALTKLTPAGQAPVRVCLCIDYSNSMRQGGKIDGAKKAALAMLGMLRDHTDHLGLYFFNGTLSKTNTTELLAMGVLSPERRKKAAQVIENTPLSGGTPMYEAMERAFAKMQNTPGRRVMIVLTDGLDTQAKTAAAKDQRIKGLGDASSKNSIPIYMITVGGGRVDEAGMKKMAAAGNGRYFHAPSGDQLKSIFVGIGETLQNEYVLEWDSPNPIEDGSNRKVVVTARHGPSGTRASSELHIPGVIATGAPRRPARAPEAGTPGPPAEALDPPVTSVFFPLGLILAGAFGVPYFFWLRSGPKAMAGGR
jgi:Ca-activated chloride channel family protein